MRENAKRPGVRFVALLRGINVGGNTMIRMEELRKTFEVLGFGSVKSYINSGNLAFDVEASHPAHAGNELTLETELVAQIERAIEKDFEKSIPVMIRARTTIDRILAANPFSGEYTSHKEMHVLFMKHKMPKEQFSQLKEAASGGERFEMAGREIYCHLPMGVADSLLGKSFIEKKLKVAVTGRNWRTVEKLATL